MEESAQHKLVKLVLGMFFSEEQFLVTNTLWFMLEDAKLSKQIVTTEVLAKHMKISIKKLEELMKDLEYYGIIFKEEVKVESAKKDAAPGAAAVKEAPVKRHLMSLKFDMHFLVSSLQLRWYRIEQRMMTSADEPRYQCSNLNCPLRDYSCSFKGCFRGRMSQVIATHVASVGIKGEPGVIYTKVEPPSQLGTFNSSSSLPYSSSSSVPGGVAIPLVKQEPAAASPPPAVKPEPFDNALRKPAQDQMMPIAAGPPTYTANSSVSTAAADSEATVLWRCDQPRCPNHKTPISDFRPKCPQYAMDHPDILSLDHQLRCRLSSGGCGAPLVDIPDLLTPKEKQARREAIRSFFAPYNEAVTAALIEINSELSARHFDKTVADTKAVEEAKSRATNGNLPPPPMSSAHLAHKKYTPSGRETARVLTGGEIVAQVLNDAVVADAAAVARDRVNEPLPWEPDVKVKLVEHARWRERQRLREANLARLKTAQAEEAANAPSSMLASGSKLADRLITAQDLLMKRRRDVEVDAECASQKILRVGYEAG